jgi:hypothetical protein
MGFKPALRRRAALVILLMSAVVCAQAISLAFEHSHQHGSQHCCTLCHSGPLPMVQPAGAATVAPTVALAWVETTSGCNLPHDVPLVSGACRAPPA